VNYKYRPLDKARNIIFTILLGLKGGNKKVGVLLVIAGLKDRSLSGSF
jgi:hypothetical protein